MSYQRHDKSYTKVYRTWIGIKTRCYYKASKRYKHYGGRGIIVQESWINDFNSFEEYVTKLPSYDANNLGNSGLSIDRIDNDGNYEEGNLRWSDNSMQGRNKRSSRPNKSGFVGVSIHGQCNKYVSSITVNKKRIHLGLRKTAKEAYQLRVNYIKDNNLKGFEI